MRSPELEVARVRARFLRNRRLASLASRAVPPRVGWGVGVAIVDPVDLLVFGPHPDDIEIGLAGTVAAPCGARRSGRAVRPDARRAGLERHAGRARGAKPRRRARCSARPGASTCAGPTAASSAPTRRSPTSSGWCGSAGRARWRCRTGTIGIPIIARRATCCGARCSAAACAGSRCDGARAATAWRPEWICYYFINDSAPVSFAVDVSAHYQRKRDALACHRSQFTPGEPASVETRLTSPRFQQLIESRDAHLGALTGVAFAEGIVRQGAAAARDALPRDRRAAAGATPVNIGIVCYASVGGSGIVATELAKCLAARGHDVHVISTDTPFRYSEYQPGLSFHRVHTPAYPLFREPQYVLSLATSIVHVARARALDIIHAHYAVPHATAAYLARQILETHGARRPGAAGRHDASRHRHHARRQRSFVCRDGRLLDRAVRRRDRGLGEPARGHLSRARRQAATSR